MDFNVLSTAQSDDSKTKKKKVCVCVCVGGYLTEWLDDTLPVKLSKEGDCAVAARAQSSV